MARRIAVLLILLVPLAASLAWADKTATPFGDPDTPMIVGWAGREIRVWVRPLPNEGYLQIARRVMADPSLHEEVAAYNGHRPVMLGRSVAFPFRLVRPQLQGMALRALYPGDYASEAGWVHRVAHPTENLIQLTEAFTGSRGKFRELARRNGLRNADLLRIGMEIVIPHEWLAEGLSLQASAVKPPLKLERDERTGRHYAVYTVQPNETLYSSVILRFTDRELAEEVRRMAARILRINGLRDEAHVPAGRALRIPLEWIADEYLDRPGAAPEPEPEPEEHVLRPPRRPRPKGEPDAGPLHVILDPGHGGVDVGATYGSRRTGDVVFEHEVVYDIALRTGRRLEALGHRTYYTISDPQQPTPVSRLPQAPNRKEVVLVSPPYRIDHANVGVNMRVYRIESLFRELTGKGVPPENVILISIHGDALAPQLRGAMVYYPDPELRHDEFWPRGRVYSLRQEALPAYIRFAEADNAEAAERSAAFGRLVLGALRDQGASVGRRRAVRSFYYRDDRRTLPAVLRYSRVPTSVLLEVANLNNDTDRRAIRDYKAREAIARGIANAVDAVRQEQMTFALTDSR